MLDMLTKPAKMQEAISHLESFIFRIEFILKSIDAHLAVIEDALKEKN